MQLVCHIHVCGGRDKGSERVIHTTQTQTHTTKTTQTLPPTHDSPACVRAYVP